MKHFSPDKALSRPAIFAHPIISMCIGLEIAIIVILSILGYSAFSNIIGIFIATIILAVISGNVPQFLRDWSLYLLGLSIFNLLRGTVYGVILLFGLPVRAHYVIHLERFLTGGYILPHQLQVAWNLFAPLQWINIQFTVLYLVHFMVFFILGFVIWKKQPQQFYRYKIAFLLALFFMILFYFFIPSIPPWLASEKHWVPTVMPLTELVVKSFSSSLFDTFNGDPIACMPSIHATFAMLCSLIAIHHFRWKAVWMLIYTVWLDIACMALGAHYLADIVMGNVLAIVIYIWVYQLKWIPLPSQKDTAIGLGVLFVLSFNIILAMGNTVLLEHVKNIAFIIR